MPRIRLVFSICGMPRNVPERIASIDIRTRKTATLAYLSESLRPVKTSGALTMNRLTDAVRGSGEANEWTCFRQTPVSHVVTLLCLLATLPMSNAAYADSNFVMGSQRQALDWAARPASPATGGSGVVAIAPQVTHGSDAAGQEHSVDAAQRAEARRLADVANADEQSGLTRTAKAGEQPRLAETANTDVPRRLAAESIEEQHPADATRVDEATHMIDEVHPTAPTAVPEKSRVEVAGPADTLRVLKIVQAAVPGPDESLLTFTPVTAQVVPASAQTPVVSQISVSSSAPSGSLLSDSGSSQSSDGIPVREKQQVALEMPPDMAKDDAPANRAPVLPPLPSMIPRLSGNMGQPRASEMLASLPAPAVPRDLSPLPPTVASRKPQADADKAAGVFAQWLEEQTDAVDEGPSPSATDLRRIFAAAVQAAADRSPQVRQAEAEYEAAKADVNEAKGQRWPQVDIGSQSKGLQFGPGYRQDDNVGNAINLNITTSVFDWGRIKKTIGSREQLSIAAQQRYQSELENSAYEVINTLVELGKQRIITDVSQKFVDRMTELVRMLGEIVAIDAGRGSELTQARGRLLQAQANRDAAQAKVRDGELNLRKLVGEDAVPIPRTREWQVQLANEMELLSDVGEHPSVQQARAEANAADLNAEVVKASARPQLNWVVNANTGRDVLGRRQSWQTMLTLNWGAFRGGSASAAYQAADQRAAASWQRIEQQQRDLEYAVRSADQDAHTFLERADLYHNLSAETNRVRKAFFEQWYHLGRRTLLDVLIAESDHYGNRVSEITTRFDGYQAVFREYASAGALVRWLYED
jgi:outer membrane protein, adhesin transport system